MSRFNTINPAQGTEGSLDIFAKNQQFKAKLDADRQQRDADRQFEMEQRDLDRQQQSQENQLDREARSSDYEKLNSANREQTQMQNDAALQRQQAQMAAQEAENAKQRDFEERTATRMLKLSQQREDQMWNIMLAGDGALDLMRDEILQVERESSDVQSKYAAAKMAHEALKGNLDKVSMSTMKEMIEGGVAAIVSAQKPIEEALPDAITKIMMKAATSSGEGSAFAQKFKELTERKLVQGGFSKAGAAGTVGELGELSPVPGQAGLANIGVDAFFETHAGELASEFSKEISTELITSLASSGSTVKNPGVAAGALSDLMNLLVQAQNEAKMSAPGAVDPDARMRAVEGMRTKYQQQAKDLFMKAAQAMGPQGEQQVAAFVRQVVARSKDSTVVNMKMSRNNDDTNRLKRAFLDDMAKTGAAFEALGLGKMVQDPAEMIKSTSYFYDLIQNTEDKADFLDKVNSIIGQGNQPVREKLVDLFDQANLAGVRRSKQSLDDAGKLVEKTGEAKVRLNRNVENLKQERITAARKQAKDDFDEILRSK